MLYISVTEAAKKWGISRKRVQVLCVEGRIAGSQKVGTYWAIPEESAKPDDLRRKRDNPAAEKPPVSL